MRTTVEFDDDTAAAIDQLRRASGIGLSEAVNDLIRRGLLPTRDTPRFVQQTHRLGIQLDVSNIADTLEVLESPRAR